VFMGAVLLWRSGFVLERLAERGRRLQSELPGSKRCEKPSQRLLFLVWFEGRGSRERHAAREKLLGQVTYRLVEKYKIEDFSWYIDDAENDAKSTAVNIAPLSRPVRAQLTMGEIDSLDQEKRRERGKEITSLLKSEGFVVASYLVNETIYTDYGEYRGDAIYGWNPSLKRTWGRGERSPYKVTLSAFCKPANMSQVEFRRLWFDYQSPMSEILQPRARYVRNEIILVLTDDSPPYSGVVIECWPSRRHMENPFFFFNARNPWELAVHIAVMLRSVCRMMQLSKICGSTASEYIFTPSHAEQ